MCDTRMLWISSAVTTLIVAGADSMDCSCNEAVRTRTRVRSSIDKESTSLSLSRKEQPGTHRAISKLRPTRLTCAKAIDSFIG